MGRVPKRLPKGIAIKKSQEAQTFCEFCASSWLILGGSMRRMLVLAIIGSLWIALTLWAQVQPPPAPWRGAGPTPCVGSDGGIYQCPPAPRPIAIRAGRLFDSKTGQMQTRQVVLLQGDRI